MTLQERLSPGTYRLTVEDYLRLDEAGAFGEEKTELLDGTVIIMNAEYRPHGWVRDELTYRLRRVLDDLDNGLTTISASARVSDHDMPLPDIVLTSEPRGEGPIPLQSIALVIEVSSTTLLRDAGVKASVYAAAGIPEYWIADVNGRVIQQLWSPTNGAYIEKCEIAFGNPLTATTIVGLKVETATL